MVGFVPEALAAGCRSPRTMTPRRVLPSIPSARARVDVMQAAHERSGQEMASRGPAVAVLADWPVRFQRLQQFGPDSIKYAPFTIPKGRGCVLHKPNSHILRSKFGRFWGHDGREGGWGSAPPIARIPMPLVRPDTGVWARIRAPDGPNPEEKGTGLKKTLVIVEFLLIVGLFLDAKFVCRTKKSMGKKQCL